MALMTPICQTIQRGLVNIIQSDMNMPTLYKKLSPRIWIRMDIHGRENSLKLKQMRLKYEADVRRIEFNHPE